MGVTRSHHDGAGRIEGFDIDFIQGHGRLFLNGYRMDVRLGLVVVAKRRDLVLKVD